MLYNFNETNNSENILTDNSWNKIVEKSKIVLTIIHNHKHKIFD